MPNQPKPDNPPRSVRIGDQLWAKAKKVAAKEGTDVSSVVRRALENYTTGKLR